MNHDRLGENLGFAAHFGVEEEAIEAMVNVVRKSTDEVNFPHISRMEDSELGWFVRLIYRLVLTSIQSSNLLLILNYLQVTGHSRFKAGFSGNETCLLLRQLHTFMETKLEGIAELREYRQHVYDCITMR
jgi:hypothetical protein